MSIQDEYRLLSDLFRQKFAGYSTFQRQNIERLMLETFSAASASNVSRWTTPATVRRNFINNQIDPKERDIRIKFARALLNEVPNNRPTKDMLFDGSVPTDGRKLKEYLTDPYVGGELGKSGALKTISTQSDGSIILLYDAYPDESFGVAQEVTPNDSEFDGILID